MEKKIDLTQSVYQLTQAYPEIIDIMASLGFTEIKKKAIRLSVGKLVTIPKGVSMKGISLETVVKALQKNGFEVVDYEAEKSNIQEKPASTDSTTQQIKALLKRLNDGEPLDSVRADFLKDFKDVPATEIMKAEQELIGEGKSVNEVKELCDVHSALFHDTSKSNDDFHHGMHHDQERMMIGQASDSKDKTARLRATDGHPLQTFYRENEAIVKALDELESRVSEGDDVIPALEKARGLAVHYAKKGDLIYPLLKVRHGIYGPSQVMWTIDDEIRAELSALLRHTAKDDADEAKWRERVSAVAKRAREMTFKEDNILFPVCAANFSDDEWKQIYADSKSYSQCLDVNPKVWAEGEAFFKGEHRQDRQQVTNVTNEETVKMPGGSLTISQLTALLDTLPMEITFVDTENINRYFNQPFAEKAFKRPLAALGREVFTCHSPKIEPMVRAIINDFREGKRDSVPVWMEKNGHTMLVKYIAVRDDKGNYVGTMEMVQDMEEIKRHFIK